MNFFTAVNATPKINLVTASVVSDGLWIDLRPDDVSGTTVIDQSGYGRNGTLYNGAIVTTAPTGETAFYTDGVNDAIHYRITSSTNKPSTGFPFTCEAWLYRDDSLGSGSANAHFGKPHISRYRMFDVDLLQTTNQVVTNNYATRARFYTNRVTDSDNSYQSNYQQVNPEVLQTEFSTSDQTWYHVVGVFYEISNVLFVDTYINGQLFKEAANDTAGGGSPTGSAWPWEGTVSGSYPMSWGFGYRERYATADIYNNQYCGDFRMYTKQLTSSEILQNYEATKSNYGY